MIQMLNDVWNGLVDKVKAVKGHYDELETAATTTNDRLNDGLSAVLDCVDTLETKYCSLRNLYDNVHTIINAQECKIRDLDNKVNFYSQDLVKLKGEKYEVIEDHFQALEQCITGQDDQIKILLTRLAEAEEGHLSRTYSEQSPQRAEGSGEVSSPADRLTTWSVARWLEPQLV